MSEPTREELIAICEAAIVPEERWRDRDSADAQRQVGEAWALLRAGCKFGVQYERGWQTDEETIWIEIEHRGFGHFEGGGLQHETFYLPTRKRVAEVDGGDWY